MIKEKNWEEFRASGMLWCANRILHMFGWALVFELEDDDTFRRCYPARVKFRGFHEIVEARGFQDLSLYLKDNINEIAEETME
jgi:hypothetical protein